jgi:hypothetical protein
MRVSDIADLIAVVRPLIQGAAMPRLVPKLVMLFMLTLVVAIIASALILAVFYAAYLALLAHGFLPMQGLLLTIAAALLFLIAALFLFKRSLRQLNYSAMPSTDTVVRAIGAFMDGFSRPKSE